MNTTISRLGRRTRTDEELGIKHSGGLQDLFDNTMKELMRINDDEYDYIAEHITVDDFDLLDKVGKTFAEKRHCIRMLEKYLTEYNAK